MLVSSLNSDIFYLLTREKIIRWLCWSRNKFSLRIFVKTILKSFHNGRKGISTICCFRVTKASLTHVRDHFLKVGSLHPRSGKNEEIMPGTLRKDSKSIHFDLWLYVWIWMRTILASEPWIHPVHCCIPVLLNN